MKHLLCPSMMCADFGNLKEEIRMLEDAGADIFHLDLMDGQFVTNYGMGLQDIEYICKHAKIPCDLHMMSMKPSDYVEKFINLGVQILYIHPEIDLQAPRTLAKIKELGAHPGIAINVGTAFSVIEPLLNLVDYVLVMTVNPGFAGQKYIDFVDDKINILLENKKKYGYKIVIDGACSPEVIERLAKEGVEGFVLGTSALFHKGRPYREIYKELEEKLNLAV